MLIKSTLFYSGSSRHSCMHSSVCCTQKALHAHHTRSICLTQAFLPLDHFAPQVTIRKSCFYSSVVPCCTPASIRKYSNAYAHGAKNSKPSASTQEALLIVSHTRFNTQMLIVLSQGTKKLTFNSHHFIRRRWSFFFSFSSGERECSKIRPEKIRC